MNLVELNSQWATSGRPHAVGEGNKCSWYCPKCEQGGRTQMALTEAMSDAVTHKYRCPSVK